MRLLKKLSPIFEARNAKKVVPLSVLGFAILIAWLFKLTQPGIKPAPPSERAWPVSVIPATLTKIVPTRKYYGTIIPAGEIEVRAELTGRILEVNQNFLDGGKINKGALLFSIDPFSFLTRLGERDAELVEARERLAELRIEQSSSKSLLSQNKEQLAIRKRELTRKEKLFRRNTIPEKSLDEARLLLNDTRQRVTTGSRDVKKLGASIKKQIAAITRGELAVETARRDLSDTKHYAPFDGFLTDVSAAAGRYVTKGEKLARLIQADKLEVKFHLGTSQFGQIFDHQGLIGKPIKIKWRGNQRVVYDGIVSRIESVIDASTGGVSLFARINDLDLRTKLRAGAFVEVFLEGQAFQSVIKIPETAVHDGFVYTVSNKRLKRHPVKIKALIDDKLIISGTFSPEDQIVTNTFNGIGPGIKVTVRK